MAEKKNQSTKLGTAGIILIILIILWVIATIAAIIQSLVCMLSSNRTGGTGQKIGGFILAWFFGPFYWIYYGLSDYCKVGVATD
jgi:flagellar basal body-associated protein FliL